MTNLNQIFYITDIGGISWSQIILPIGISFLTFQKISYLVDVYREENIIQESFIDYFMFIIFFPHSIAGPIVKYKEIKDQLTNRFSNITSENSYIGFQRFVIGLSKKILVSNPLGSYADFTFNQNTSNSSVVLLGLFAYTFQIYLDFSGYSDMAIGLSKMLGFTIPENFNFPYSSKSITEFWKRWHITLGTWMKDYLYIPLGGNQVRKSRIFVNLFTVFLISGIWHGASWNFVIWGAYYGVFLVIERLFLLELLQKIPRSLRVVYTFTIVMIGWLFFRLDNLSDVIVCLKKITDLSSYSIQLDLDKKFMICLMIAISFSIVNSSIQKIINQVFYELQLGYKDMLMKCACLVLLVLCIAELLATGFNPFIYFKF